MCWCGVVKCDGGECADADDSYTLSEIGADGTDVVDSDCVSVCSEVSDLIKGCAAESCHHGGSLTEEMVEVSGTLLVMAKCYR